MTRHQLKTPEDAWFTTGATKRKMWVRHPDPSKIHIDDIAGALAKICRFNGHCSEFYSVAQHSVLVAEQAAREGMDAHGQLAALMHDAAEAYVQDIIGPLKFCIGDVYKPIERAWESAIAMAFGLVVAGGGVKQQIKDIDLRMLATEHRDLVPDGMMWEVTEGYPPYDHKIEPIADWREARRMFMRKYDELRWSDRGGRGATT